MHALVLSVLLATIKVALPAAPPAALKFERYTLPNGLVVILHEDHSLPSVVVNIWYHVGSRDEKARRTGFAHLFEHLMFMGSKNAPYDLAKGAGLFDLVMERQGGNNNASTSTDRTNYFESGPPRLVETFLWLEADRMATLSQVMDQEKLDRQRRVVQNERRERYENRPYGKAGLIVPDELYPADHPYHHTVIGAHEDLEAATVADVNEFFNTYYVPGNASLVVAGDFDPAEVKKYIEKYFAWIPSHTPPAAPAPAPLPPYGGKTMTVTDKVKLPMSQLVWRAPADYSDDSAALDVLAAVLAGGKSSRLERALRLDHQLAGSVSGFYQKAKLGGAFVVRVIPLPGHQLEELEPIVDAEIARLASEGPDAAEVARVVAGIETASAREFESLDGRAESLNSYEFQFHDPGRREWDLARYGKVTPADVRAVAKKVLDPKTRLTLRIVPEPEAAPPSAKEPR